MNPTEKEVTNYHVGRRIRELRLRRCLTMKQLAQRAGTSRSFIWELENNRTKRPGVHLLSQIAMALGTTVDYLISLNPTEGTEGEAVDRAFYRKYLSQSSVIKKKIRKILDVLIVKPDPPKSSRE